MPGRVEFTGKDAAGKSYVIKLFPEGGKASTIYLDKSTFLPQREERPAASVTQTTTFSEWRNVGGVMVPGKSFQTNGDPKFDATQTLETVDWSPVFEANLFSKPSETALPVQFAAGQHETEFAFEPMGNHILVPVRVNGSQPAWFFFDSGADLSVVDAAWAKKLGLSSKGSIGISGTGEGSAELGMLSNISFDLPGVVVPVKSFGGGSLAPLLPFFGREINGIVGYDVISRFVVEIDYAGHMIHLHDPATLRIIRDMEPRCRSLSSRISRWFMQRFRSKGSRRSKANLRLIPAPACSSPSPARSSIRITLLSAGFQDHRFSQRGNRWNFARLGRAPFEPADRSVYFARIRSRPYRETAEARAPIRISLAILAANCCAALRSSSIIRTR